MANETQANAAVNFTKASTYNFFNGFGGPVWGALAAYYGPLMALMGFLGASAFYNGVINGLFWLGFFLPQIPAAYYSERLKRKKWVMGTLFIISGAFELIFAMILLMTGGANHRLMLVCFMICYGLATLTFGFATPMIFSLLFKIIPQKKLGSWLGIYFLFNSVAGIVGGIVVKRVLEYGYPVAFEILFAGVFLCTILMAILIWIVDEPEGELAPRKENFGAYLGHCIGIIKSDKNLVRFFFGMWLVVGHYIVVTYYSRYAMSGDFGISKSQAGAFVSMNLVGWSLASLGPLFVVLYPLQLMMKVFGGSLPFATNIFSAGWIADRLGPKQTLITFQVMALAGVLVALSAKSLNAFYIVWVCAGFAQICNNIGYTNMTMLSCKIEDKSTYVGLVNFVVFPLVVVLPMVVGALLGRGTVSYQTVFLVSAGLMVSAILYFTFFVENPETFKQMKAERMKG